MQTFEKIGKLACEPARLVCDGPSFQKRILYLDFEASRKMDFISNSE
jgi:hypothetical protein